MSINENQEFEAINRASKERSENVDEYRQTVADTYREVKARRKAKAIYHIVALVVLFASAIAFFYGLEVIGWINGTFRIVLMCVAGAVGMFKIGYYWHDLKQ